MDHQPALNALVDPTRRAILEYVVAHPESVSEIADQLPVSRPAVSQHLKILTEAGLLQAETRGTRRYYRLDPNGLVGLRGYINALWSEALSAYADAAYNEVFHPEQDEQEGAENVPTPTRQENG